MVSSWSKMILNHINNDVNIFQDGKLIAENARVINIDLDNNRIIVRKEQGEGVQITIIGGAIVIEDVKNYRPGRSEYNQMHGIEDGRSPEELIRSY
jgi:hypothetical protein